MKQTLEEAAIEAAEDCYEMPYDENLINMKLVKEAVEYGAKWQAKQSPWINVEERLPEDSQEVLILMKYITPRTKVIRYQIVQCTYLKAFGMKVFESHKKKVIVWMPIPSFDEILEANRDVLERIKEIGD